MRIAQFFTALFLSLLMALCLRAQTTAPLFPIDEVRPGLKGVGRTTFEGDKIEEFQVEILGVMKNVLAPKHNLILARLSGGPLAKTGVIAGMSGSPIYIDGKLVGALSIAFPFSKEPVAGITPIGEMLEVVPEAKTPEVAQPTMSPSYWVTRGPSGSPEAGRLIPEEATEPPRASQPASAGSEALWMANLRLPLRFGGFSSQAIDLYAPLFRQWGFEPMLGGGAEGSEAAAVAKTDLEPGSMISLVLVRGDMNVNADCTVTYRRDDQLYACGHFVLSLGPAELPFAPSRVLATVPSLAISFRLDAPGQVVGTIRQDRFSAIYGKVGDNDTKMIPIHVRVHSTLNKETDYNFQMVQEPFITPVLLNLSLVSTFGATERRTGPSTLELKGQIRLSQGESVEIDDVLSSDFGAERLAASTVATPVNYVLAGGFPNLRIEDIDLSVVSLNENRAATLEQVWSTKSEVHPGDHLEVTALLRLPSGQAVTQKIPLQIPDSVTDKMLSLIVGSGSSLNAMQFRLAPLGSTPRDLHQLVRALNRMRRNNRLYALLMTPERSFFMRGDEYPSPPPSLVQTFLADPAVSSSMVFTGTSVVGDFETKSSPYTINGQKMLTLKVVSPGT